MPQLYDWTYTSITSCSSTLYEGLSGYSPIISLVPSGSMRYTWHPTEVTWDIKFGCPRIIIAKHKPSELVWPRVRWPHYTPPLYRTLHPNLVTSCLLKRKFWGNDSKFRPRPKNLKYWEGSLYDFHAMWGLTQSLYWVEELAITTRIGCNNQKAQEPLLASHSGNILIFSRRHQSRQWRWRPRQLAAPAMCKSH